MRPGDTAALRPLVCVAEKGLSGRREAFAKQSGPGPGVTVGDVALAAGSPYNRSIVPPFSAQPKLSRPVPESLPETTTFQLNLSTFLEV